MWSLIGLVLTALLKAAPDFIRLMNIIMARVQEREQRAIGRTEAIVESLQEAHRLLAEADAERLAAEAQHRADGDDTAFDQEFRRG